MEKGDLVHIPQAAKILKLSHNNNIIEKEVTISEPTVGIFVESWSDRYCNVMLKNDTWAIERKSVYPLE